MYVLSASYPLYFQIIILIIKDITSHVRIVSEMSASSQSTAHVDYHTCNMPITNFVSKSQLVIYNSWNGQKSYVMQNVNFSLQGCNFSNFMEATSNNILFISN